MQYFSDKAFTFFRDLAANNQRDWFNANKQRYIDEVRDPFLAFITEVDQRIKVISPYYGGNPKANGGSLFRIYRDTRFSKDKTPYKTWAGARFTHSDRGRHGAPVFYLHLQPGQVFIGAGIWHPEARQLNTLRTFLQNNPSTWLEVTRNPAMRRHFKLGGSSLKRSPRGFDPDHPLAEDIKRKDFVISTRITDKQVLSPRFMTTFINRCELASPFIDYLCAALDLEF
jgi:uncharacterized protein (TIGR02453 family)